MNLTLRSMTAEEFAVWLPRQTAAYAADKVRAGNWPAETAQASAERETAALLPAGLATPEHEILTVTAGGEPVGVVWVHVPADAALRGAFLYDIEVDPAHQGRGYGSAALTELERLLAARGVRKLRLHVFGFNAGAQRLYERLGYHVTNVSMEKELG